MDPKKERYAALIDLRDTALAAAKLIEEQMILESRFEDYNPKVRKCQEIDTLAEYQTPGLQDIEILNFAGRVKDVVSRARGRQATLNLFMGNSSQFRVASYSSITWEQYPQLLTWLEGFDS